jgi:hypothetical protein
MVRVSSGWQSSKNSLKERFINFESRISKHKRIFDESISIIEDFLEGIIIGKDVLSESRNTSIKTWRKIVKEMVLIKSFIRTQ